MYLKTVSARSRSQHAGRVRSPDTAHWLPTATVVSSAPAMNEQSITDRYTLADLERWSEVAGEIDPPIRLGVFGDPVAHSLSPQMQNAALGTREIKAQYARFHIRANELRSALLFLRRLDFIGINLTVPHKIAAFTHVDEADESATRT